MALIVLSLSPFDISVGVGAFVIGLGQISFLSDFYIYYANNELKSKGIVQNPLNYNFIRLKLQKKKMFTF